MNNPCVNVIREGTRNYGLDEMVLLEKYIFRLLSVLLTTVDLSLKVAFFEVPWLPLLTKLVIISLSSNPHRTKIDLSK